MQCPSSSGVASDAPEGSRATLQWSWLFARECEPIELTTFQNQDRHMCAEQHMPRACIQEASGPAAQEVRKKPSRPCKQKRNRYKKLVDQLKVMISESPETFDIRTVALPPRIAKNDERRRKLMHDMQQYQRQLRDGEDLHMTNTAQSNSEDQSSPVTWTPLFSISI